ncbi:hypothetical protein KFK09_015701 [Dendrobium nobile]|uniref:Uncharacterized protein n=1 Tax=Dendrobium nobile TaxID=94219 RepID=A0A8T3B6R4_DENNO|nr:hypothetical protein KFK09_015701 [Dendrobium nobile]
MEDEYGKEVETMRISRKNMKETKVKMVTEIELKLILLVATFLSVGICCDQLLLWEDASLRQALMIHSSRCGKEILDGLYAGNHSLCLDGLLLVRAASKPSVR